MAIKIDRIESNGALTFAVEGEVDLYTSPDLRAAILNAAPPANGVLAVDLRGVSYMDSSGVATLVEGLKSAGQKKASFVLMSPSPSVMKVLQLSRLDAVFEIRMNG